MKYAFAVMALFVTHLASAKCIGSGFDVFPCNGAVSINSSFILTGFGSAQSFIDSVSTGYNAYLACENGKLLLSAVSKHVGQYGEAQVLLKPTAPLARGMRYQLMIERRNGTTYFVTRIGGEHPAEWTAHNETDSVRPTLNSIPEPVGHIVRHFGCGPEIFVKYKFNVRDGSEVYVLTTVTKLATQESASYYLRLDNEVLYIGHGMCYGAFNFDKDAKYRVSFVLVDACGNRSSVPESFQFTGPS